MKKTLFKHFIHYCYYCHNAINFKQYLRRELDMRLKTSKELFAYACTILEYDKHWNEYLLGKSTYGWKKEIIEIRKKRVRNYSPYVFTNVLDNPLVKDIKKNKPFITYISKDLVQFSGGRNHWSKSNLDSKILLYYKRKLNK